MFLVHCSWWCLLLLVLVVVFGVVVVFDDCCSLLLLFLLLLLWSPGVGLACFGAPAEEPDGHRGSADEICDLADFHKRLK